MEVRLETMRKMNPVVFVICIVTIMTVNWMACDMFLPAQPQIVEYFNTDAATLNLALSVYFVGSAVSVLVGGPLSDKFGRKPMLLLGVLMFTLFGFGCTFAPSVWFLIVCRGGASLGGGFMSAVTMAMVKDYLDIDLFQKAMAIIQSVIVLGPVVAPFLGSFMLMIGNWRWTLGAIAFLGVICVIITLCLPETLPKERRVNGGMLPAMKGLVEVGKDRNFSILLLIISFMCMPFFAFIAVCSYICMDFFGMTYIQYSVFYAGICLVSFTAPFVYLWLDKRFPSRNILMACFILLVTTTLGLVLFGKISPIVLLLVFLPYTYAEGISRPLGMVLLLNQHDDTSGAASALTSFATSIIGTLGTVVATLHWGNYLDGLFWCFTGCLVLALSLWGLLIKLKVKL
ncbi:MAG: MFS transporter [Firmicutes bacterium]|nr:MFS transporter [Bacillota bacterium]